MPNDVKPTAVITVMGVFRKKKNLTQLELGHMVGEPQGVISLIESKMSTPKEETIKKIAEILGVDPKDLLLEYEEYVVRNNKKKR